MNRGDGAAKVCARVNEVMKALPRPRRGATREEFFAQRNLWSVEIQSTCDQVIEYYEGILLLVDQGGCTDRLPPLARSIHEASFRLEYPSRNKSELRDWFEGQMSCDYHFMKDFLQYETTVSDSRNYRAQMQDLVAAMGGPPKKRGFPWREPGEILRDISSDMPDGHDKRLRRLLYEYPSSWTLRILSGISEGICNTMVQSGGEFLYIGVGGR